MTVSATETCTLDTAGENAKDDERVKNGTW